MGSDDLHTAYLKYKSVHIMKEQYRQNLETVRFRQTFSLYFAVRVF